MGAIFEQLKGGQENLKKCLSAMEQAWGSSELWFDSIKKSSLKEGRISKGSTVLLHWWKNIKDTEIKWEYWLTTKNEDKFEYEDFSGKHLYIYDSNGHTKVSKSVGISENIISEIENLPMYKISEYIEQLKFKGILGNDDSELKIVETL